MNTRPKAKSKRRAVLRVFRATILLNICVYTRVCGDVVAICLYQSSRRQFYNPSPLKDTVPHVKHYTDTEVNPVTVNAKEMSSGGRKEFEICVCVWGGGYILARVIKMLPHIIVMNKQDTLQTKHTPNKSINQSIVTLGKIDK